ncbi:uncharacterized protein LOC111714706 [Eurytemora carolleeae]|uniref:uncharacterized protein LOC111714706 n=1 Tax=Eurytemora carolleeae TaxID=1294199 RepID=UPI000C766C26|nr:uncharacterized protein LOC111714706 [Eurytemora carolleeae]|eukprot:XP_023345631.1 uncharacterized protein LOC111714706 [Eurytemora affinis]
MTKLWVGRLLVDQQLSIEEYENIPQPRLELHTHVLYKGIQVGLVLGMGVIGPIVGYRKGKSLSSVMQYAVKGGKIGAGVMIPLAPIMTELTIRGNEQERIYDRAFRLRHHETQLRADRWSTYGCLSGTILSAVSGSTLVSDLCTLVQHL